MFQWFFQKSFHGREESKWGALLATTFLLPPAARGYLVWNYQKQCCIPDLTWFIIIIVVFSCTLELFLYATISSKPDRYYELVAKQPVWKWQVKAQQSGRILFCFILFTDSILVKLWHFIRFLLSIDIRFINVCNYIHVCPWEPGLFTLPNFITGTLKMVIILFVFWNVFLQKENTMGSGTGNKSISQSAFSSGHDHHHPFYHQPFCPCRKLKGKNWKT